MAQAEIIIRLSDAALDALQCCNGREARGKKLLELIDVELEATEQWFEANMGGGLVKFERAILRTFLYRKITGELSKEGDITDLAQVHHQQVG